MTPIELFKLWAPEEAPWSDWAKPVLFADSGIIPKAPRLDWRSFDVDWAPAGDLSTAVVADLDEALPVWLGIALAARGYRPVPLFNGATGPSPVLDAGWIAGALRTAATDLATISLPADAPPVFLLDARRGAANAVVSPGRFDNRWVVFPQDFPSANFLLSHGIRTVLLAHASSGAPQSDLAHVLLRWQEAGLVMLSCDVRDGQATPMEVRRPSRFRHLWYRALVLAGLRRNSAGGFGAVVPQPSQGGG